MPFSKETIEKVWLHARAATELDPEVWRKDECGAWIRREHYGREDSEFGWNIVNVSAGEPDALENLRPMHHANRYDRANRRARCKVKADQAGLPATGRVREPRNRPA